MKRVITLGVKCFKDLNGSQLSASNLIIPAQKSLSMWAAKVEEGTMIHQGYACLLILI